MNEIKSFIKRDVFEDLKKHLLKKEITLIAGPRQAGKTTLMMMLKKHLELSGKKTVFLSLDFENDQKFFSSQNSLVEKLKLEFGNNEGYVFIDEIQRKENAGVFLKRNTSMAIGWLIILPLKIKKLLNSLLSILISEGIRELLPKTHWKKRQGKYP